MEISIKNDQIYPSETIEDCEIIYSDSAQVRVILNAPILNRFVLEEPFLEFDKGLRVQFFNQFGKKESELISDYGKIDEKNDLMVVKNNVVIRNINGDILETDLFNWDENKQEIYTDDFVKITTKSEVIYGQGFVSNQNFSKYTIKNIKGTILLED